jgi:hypothetical protein
VGQEKVRIMYYDPRRPYAERYVQNPVPASKKLLERVERDSLTLCRALGYDLNTVEFAVEKEIPYAIDFMNPAPDADLHSVGKENFEWIVDAVADLAVKKVRAAKPKVPEFHWSAYLGAASRTAKAEPVPAAAPKAVAKKAANAARTAPK